MTTSKEPDSDSEDSDHEPHVNKQITKTKKTKRVYKPGCFRVPDSDSEHSDYESDASQDEHDSNYTDIVTESNDITTTHHQGDNGQEPIDPYYDAVEDMEVDSPGFGRAVNWVDGTLTGISAPSASNQAQVDADFLASVKPSSYWADCQTIALNADKEAEILKRKRDTNRCGTYELMDGVDEEPKPYSPARAATAPPPRPFRRAILVDYHDRPSQALPQHSRLSINRSAQNSLGLSDHPVAPSQRSPFQRVRTPLPGSWPTDPATLIETRDDDPEQPLRRIDIGFLTTLPISIGTYAAQVWRYWFPLTQATEQNTQEQVVNTPQQPTTDAVEIIAVEMHGGTKRRAVEATSPSPAKSPAKTPSSPQSLCPDRRTREQQWSDYQIIQNMLRNEQEIARQQKAQEAAERMKYLSSRKAPVDGTPDQVELRLPSQPINAGQPTAALAGTQGVVELRLPNPTVAGALAKPRPRKTGAKKKYRSRAAEMAVREALPQIFDDEMPELPPRKKAISPVQRSVSCNQQTSCNDAEPTTEERRADNVEKIITKAKGLYIDKEAVDRTAREAEERATRVAEELAAQIAREEQEAAKRARAIEEEKAAEKARIIEEEKAGIIKEKAAEEARIIEERKRLRAASTILTLSDAKVSAIRDAVNISKKDPVCKVENTPLNKTTFKRILSRAAATTSWLDDDAVNSWFAALVRAKNLHAGYDVKTASKDVVPPIVAFNSNWYSSIQGPKGIKHIERWASRSNIKADRLLQCQMIFLPINRHSHWVLVIINVTDGTIEYLDSMGDSRSGIAEIKAARAFLKQELGGAYDAQHWKDQREGSNAQTNTNDCGVFTCFNGLAAAKGLDFHAIQASKMPEARIHMAGLFLNGGFTGDFAL